MLCFKQRSLFEAQSSWQALVKVPVVGKELVLETDGFRDPVEVWVGG